MELVTVFDIAQSGYRAREALISPAILTLVGIGMLVFWTGPRAERWVVFRWFYFLSSLSMTTFIAWHTYSDYVTLIDARRSGAFEVVEGPVENFDPMPAWGHKHEAFSVRGVEFSYSDFRITSAFNNSASHGGPIRRGAYVRVSYVGGDHSTDSNQIIRLEMRAQDIPSAAERQNWRP